MTAAEILNSLATRNERGGIGTAKFYLQSWDGLTQAKDFEKELANAADRLTFCDNDPEWIKQFDESTSITPGAILEYDCILSTRTKDRDGDILETKGLVVDPAMPLLWQHAQFSPIGKHVKVLHQDEERLICKFAIADTPLGHDAAALVKFGALRKSHGFVPLEFEPLGTTKGADGHQYTTGWHVKRANVFEGSLVSIPANSDANLLAVYGQKSLDGLCTVYSRNMLRTDAVKEWAKALFDKRPVIAQGVSFESQVTKTLEKLTDAVKSLQENNSKDVRTMPTLADLSKEQGSESGGAGTVIRPKKPSERYSKSANPVVNKQTGKALTVLGNAVSEPSACDYAKIGAWAKHYFNSGKASEMLHAWGARPPAMNEHEKALVAEMLEDDYFCGDTKNGWVDRATIKEAGLDVKTLLNDSTSGGNSLVPYAYDSALISYPYLHSQLLPYVDLRTTNSSEVKTSTLGQVSVMWGIDEGTAISIFNTDSLIGEKSFTVHPVTAAIEWGKDLELDTPVAELGQKLVEQFGQAMMKELDYVVCLGNGTNQPEGFLNAAGTVTVNSAGGTGATNTFADWVNLNFGIAKEYRDQGSALNPVFVSNDTTYLRKCLIRIDPQTSTTDQRPVLGDIGSFQNYETLKYPHKINAAIGNSVAAFVCLKKYRLYRRAGFDFFITDQGAQLARANKRLMVVRGRYAGALADPNAAAIAEDFKS